MARQSIKEQSINRLPTGLEGQNIPDDFMIPACSVEDVDRAVFNLFEKGLTHPLTIKENEVSPRSQLFLRPVRGSLS